MALRFEPVERGIQSADGHGAAGAKLDFLPDGNSVRCVAQAEDGEENNVFEFAEVIIGHI